MGDFEKPLKEISVEFDCEKFEQDNFQYDVKLEDEF
jgi:hypothetical protein